MSGKSVLVMDTPKNGCADCIVCRESFFKTICGITGNGVSGNNERGGFPEECPLKPMPERMILDRMRQEAIEEDCYDDTNGIDEAYLQGKERGWNACIDEILGGGVKS